MMEKETRYTILDNHVIAVAVEGAIKDWSAYIGAIEGIYFDHEYEQVARTGSKLRREVAEVMFPDFAKKFTWRE